jgi:membrane-bound ClpP family serine protease
MNLIVLLFLMGVVLLGFEVLVPGAILGIFGGLSLLTGCVLAFVKFGATPGFISVGVALVLVGAMLFLEFFVLPKTRLGQRLFLRASITGTAQALGAEAAGLVGKTADALTALAPTGYVMVEGRRFEAVSLDGLIEKGTKLRVSAFDNFTLKVTKI